MKFWEINLRHGSQHWAVCQRNILSSKKVICRKSIPKPKHLHCLNYSVLYVYTHTYIYIDILLFTKWLTLNFKLCFHILSVILIILKHLLDTKDSKCALLFVEKGFCQMNLKISRYGALAETSDLVIFLESRTVSNIMI